MNQPQTLLSERVRPALLKAIELAFNQKVSSQSLVVQPTSKEHSGDFTLLVFPLAKILGGAPESVARTIGSALLQAEPDLIRSIEVVKGFLNLTIQDGVWQEFLKHYTSNHSTPSAGRGKVMVEFSSPNTNKPLHLGHLRNIFLGDALCRILTSAGYEVVRANLINDRGIHICKSMAAYLNDPLPRTPESTGIKGDHLVGEYYVAYDKQFKKEVADLINQGVADEDAAKQAPILVQAQELLRLWEQNDREVYALWQAMNNWVYSGFEQTYHTLGITFDQVYYESNTYLLGKEIIEEGLEKGVFYRKTDGSVWIDLKEEKLDEKLVLRSDGTSVYITQDMGTADLKYKDHGCERSVYVVGNEQDYHFKVLFAILKKLGRPYAEGLYHMSYGMVELPEGRMKSREGTVVDADDLLDEMYQTAKTTTETLGKTDDMGVEEAEKLYHILGLGALKYFLLKVDPKKKMLFNPEESVQFQGNTGPFIQYTHARIRSIARKAAMDQLSGMPSGQIALHESERQLLLLMHQYSEVIEQAAADYSPALVANHVFELAKAYNRFYAEVPIFNDPSREHILLRVRLSEAVGETIRHGMGLLGIEVPERM